MPTQEAADLPGLVVVIYDQRAFAPADVAETPLAGEQTAIELSAYAVDALDPALINPVVLIRQLLTSATERGVPAGWTAPAAGPALLMSGSGYLTTLAQMWYKPRNWSYTT